MSEFEIRSPYDGALVGRVHEHTPAEVDEAVVGAVRAVETTRKMAGYERQEILWRVSRAIAEQAEAFAQLMVREAGKPVRAARAEVERAEFTFRVAAEESVRMGGEVLPLDWQASTKGNWSMIRRFPVGVVLAITPFNFPLNLVAHKLAPAMAVGCTVVLKPAPQTALTARKLAEIVYEAGWPRDALAVLHVANERVGELVRDERMQMLSFTGSAAVGWELKAKAGKKKVALELGGNAGVIVHADGDVELAAQRCVAGAFTYAGQSCISVQRIFVHEAVEERFTRRLRELAAGLKVGDPGRADTDVGPMIRASDVDRVESWIDEAKREGAKELLGEGAGRRTPESASVIRPSILTDTRAEMKVNAEEIFAPVCTVEAYRELREAIASINSSRYGLQTGIFTHDMRAVMEAFENLQVGGVVLNDVPTFRIDHMPYGGVKDSGLGREGVRWAMEEMTEPRALIVRGL
ncbi:MAG: aldehyde dehydrogenase family protein [Acidobacteriales bacterium]|nr:aldehyde dehydrogenase family protein [Terriglobales bacterium]